MQQHDPLTELLEYAAESCEQRSEANVLRNLEAVSRADEALSQELQRQIVAIREASFSS